MKSIVILGDGMADYPLKDYGDKTPLELAKKPVIDALAKKAVLGMVTTVPGTLPPGSDVANLSVMGYDPQVYYTGRSPLEAASIGVPLKEGDTTFRCNLVTLSEDEPYENKTMVDYSADEISTEEARQIIADIAAAFDTDTISFYGGIAYRHLMVWNGAGLDFNLTPPHDISDRKITEHLPKGPGSERILEMMKKSNEILKNHPVNQKRIAKGLHPANSIWIWGEGSKPNLDSFEEKYHVKGAVVSAVDLVKGIGVCAGMDVVEVEGATGNIDTNFEGKAEAAINALKNGCDLVYLHFEAPDECGHRGQVENKIKSIEYIDSRVTNYLLKELEEMGEDYSVLIMPDHPTPLSIKTHTRDAVPFLLYRSWDEKSHPDYTYDEKCAQKTGVYVERGCTLMEQLLRRR